MSDKATRVLVVDDSAFARKVVRQALDGHRGMVVVGIARDGLDALEKIAELSPDVVTLDLVMPNLDGVGVLKALQDMPKRPAVVIVSMTDPSSDLGVAALDLGAFDVVSKPTALATDQLYELADELRAKVLAASERPSWSRSMRPRPELREAPKASGTRLVLIGASTGGPPALTLLLRSLPGDFPVPIAIVVHMPEGYTEAFAQRVDADSRLDVMEARHGLSLEPGRAIIARAGSHLGFRTEGGVWKCTLDARPFGMPHRPSVDVLFQSGAAVAGAGTLGVVLTGMGNDGLVGARSIHEGGGRVLTEAESSCVVYGMPRTIVEAHLSHASAPIESMASLIVQHL